MKNNISQSARAAILVGDIAILLCASRLAFGAFTPPTGDSGFWFYTAMLSLVLGNRLFTPFFAKPVDAVAYSVPAAVALLLVYKPGPWDLTAYILYYVALGYSFLLLTVAFGAMLVKDSARLSLQNMSNLCRSVAEVLANPEIVFGLIFLFALYAFHRSSPVEIFWLSSAWLLVAVVRPLETALRTVGRIKDAIARSARSKTTIAKVVAYQHPRVVLAEEAGGRETSFGTPVILHDPQEGILLGVAAGHAGRVEGKHLRILLEPCRLSSELPDSVPFDIPIGCVERLTVQALVDIRAHLGRSLTIDRSSELIGTVTTETSVSTLQFEVLRASTLKEGSIVEVRVGREQVLYQVTNGLTKEEAVHQKNTYGYIKAEAENIGAWDAERSRFVLVPWVPDINTPVFLKAAEASHFDVNAVGAFPGTNFTVGIKNINELVTHNTAVLGILGVGKTMLAVELVERMLVSGIKVVCLDLTDQYAVELAPYYDAHHEQAAADAIRDACDKDRDQWHENPDQGGSRPNLVDAIRRDLEEFLREDNHRRLKIYNPAKLIATKQLNEPKTFKDGSDWKRQASLWTVTPVEVTQIVTEAVLALCQNEMVDHAKVCLVYEEAHSLIPEWNAVASDEDRIATNGTARAILQGRKYGVGCLVVTQRTASVTKTILNQCNNVFAMRTFDSTGKEFLSSYVGRSYASTLSSIPAQHAVFFGKASTSENPVLIKLNDRSVFIREFRAINPPPPVPQLVAEEKVPVTAEDEFDDDIPF